MAGEIDVTTTRSMRIGGLTIAYSAGSPADQHVAISKTIPANSTDVQIDLSVDISDAVAYAVWADQDCTVETNSASSPTDTLNLSRKIALQYVVGDPAANAFLSADVTALFITTGANPTLFRFAAAEDTTPGI
jgi:hypothetical protein